MSKDHKRYRQINIKESFALCKKTKTTPPVPTMEQNLRDLMAASSEKSIIPSDGFNEVSETNTPAPNMKQNLRDLMAAAAEKRLPSQKIREVPDINNKLCNSNVNYGATTSKTNSHQTELEVTNSEENFLSCSAELFPDSAELYSDSPTVEQCSSQETEDLDIVDPPSQSSNSPEIFSDDGEAEVDSQLEEDDSAEEVQLTFLNRKPKCCLPLSIDSLKPSENHSIMFSPHVRPGDAPRPYPSAYRDRWDFNHVRMPCSPMNKYPVENLSGEKEIRSRWDLICRSLRRPINSSQDLENAILQYNSQYRAKWNFNNLHTLLNKCLSEDEQTHFFEVVLPVMINMALDLPTICTQPVPLLKKNRDHSVTMSQKQIGCLLLNAFFCTFPRRNLARRWNNEYGNYPDINFNRLFFGVKDKTSSTSIEKLKCLINYFRRISSVEPSGTVTFHRQFLQELPKWQSSSKSIRSVVVKSEGLIENEGHGMLQVDFANKFVGGGVLGHGCVQEEIRFIICPELIVSRLFVECLGPTEVLIITGVEQYCDYSGYSDTFQWEGNHLDKTPRDAWGRRYTEVVAMDATHFTNVAEQFKLPCIVRELNKAYCGFYENALPPNLSAVATGNWGCGAFNGNPSIKFIIQLMAASQIGRDLLYFTFGNKAMKRELKNIARVLIENSLVVGDLCKILIAYSKTVQVSRKGIYPKMYDFICSLLVNEDAIEDASPSEPEQSITDSDKTAINKLLEAVAEDSNTEVEDNGESASDHG